MWARRAHTGSEGPFDVRDGGCACTPGDNAAFLTGPAAGYPTKESVIWTKPILRLGDAYYCPSPPILFRSSIEVLESLLNKGHTRRPISMVERTRWSRWPSSIYGVSCPAAQGRSVANIRSSLLARAPARTPNG
jgi:hypothetical protein